MSSDALIRFEEDNWTTLAEKFIHKHIDEWDTFVWGEFENSQSNPPDREKEV